MGDKRKEAHELTVVTAKCEVLEERLEELRTDHRKALGQVESLSSQVISLQEELSKVRETVASSAMKSENSDLKVLLETATREKALLEADNERLTEEVEKLHAAVSLTTRKTSNETERRVRAEQERNAAQESARIAEKRLDRSIAENKRLLGTASGPSISRIVQLEAALVAEANARKQLKKESREAAAELERLLEAARAEAAELREQAQALTQERDDEQAKAAAAAERALAAEAELRDAQRTLQAIEAKLFAATNEAELHKTAASTLREEMTGLRAELGDILGGVRGARPPRAHSPSPTRSESVRDDPPSPAHSEPPESRTASLRAPPAPLAPPRRLSVAITLERLSGVEALPPSFLVCMCFFNFPPALSALVHVRDGDAAVALRLEGAVPPSAVLLKYVRRGSLLVFLRAVASSAPLAEGSLALGEAITHAPESSASVVLEGAGGARARAHVSFSFAQGSPLVYADAFS